MDRVATLRAMARAERARHAAWRGAVAAAAAAADAAAAAVAAAAIVVADEDEDEDGRLPAAPPAPQLAHGHALVAHAGRATRSGTAAALAAVAGRGRRAATAPLPPGPPPPDSHLARALEWDPAQLGDLALVAGGHEGPWARLLLEWGGDNEE